MSQKKRDFQSKPGFGGRKFGDKGKGRGRPEGRSFGERSEGDREDRPRPPRDRDSRNRGFGDKPRGRPFENRAPRDHGERGGGFGGKSHGRPFEKRPYDNRDPRPPRDRDDRNKSFGGKPYKKREFRADGDNPYKKREFGGNKPFNREKRHGDRPRRRDDRLAALHAPRPDVGHRLKSDRPSYGAPSSAYLYGIHAVSQALLNPKRLHQRLLCTQKGFESLAETWAEAQGAGITLPQVTTLEKEDLDRLLPRDAVHQDVLLDCQPLEEMFLADVLISAPENATVLVLDQVTDPHNVGAILRSAAAFGAVAVVMQKLHAPDITGTLAKAASGAVEHVPIVREVNLSRALEQLKEAGFFCIGLDEDGKRPLAGLHLTGKTALVLGAEGAGLRRLVAENCDELARLPTQGPIGSLNVSNAAAVALYELARKP